MRRFRPGVRREQLSKLPLMEYIAQRPVVIEQSHFIARVADNVMTRPAISGGASDIINKPCT